MSFCWNTLSKISDATYIRIGLLWIVIASVAKCIQHIDEMHQKRLLQDQTHLAEALEMPVRDVSAYPGLEDFLQRHPVYISLSTIPKRIGYIEDVLRSIDLRWVEKVFIAVPERFTRTNEEYHIPASLLFHEKVEIIKAEKDEGPITKLLPALEKVRGAQNGDALLIVLDDDYIYPRGLVLEHAYAVWQGKKTSASSAIVAQLGEKAKMPHAYRINKTVLQRIFTQKDPRLVHGVGSIGFLASAVDENMVRAILAYEQKQGSNDCYLSDDAVLSYMLQKKGVEIQHINTKYLSHPMLQPLRAATEIDAIHNIPALEKTWNWLGKGKDPSAIEVRLARCFTTIAQYQATENMMD
ncbi:MAG: hypothetical protein VX112_04135, partial [Pseudomonadota bacterium]|nr:hypothetical protein [Pseudomonadota bacterium]